MDPWTTQQTIFVTNAHNFSAEKIFVCIESSWVEVLEIEWGQLKREEYGTHYTVAFSSLWKEWPINSWTTYLTRESRSTYQVHQVSTSGCNQAQMDYHSKCQHEHHSGMHPWVSHAKLLRELPLPSQPWLWCQISGYDPSLQFLMKAAESLCKKGGSGHWLITNAINTISQVN